MIVTVMFWKHLTQNVGTGIIRPVTFVCFSFKIKFPEFPFYCLSIANFQAVKHACFLITSLTLIKSNMIIVNVAPLIRSMRIFHFILKDKIASKLNL